MVRGGNHGNSRSHTRNPRTQMRLESGQRPRGGAADARAPGTTEEQRTEVAPVPAIPVSAGALIFDRRGRLLIIKPTYKSGWTIPGGVMEADGETPWQACMREVR